MNRPALRTFILAPLLAFSLAAQDSGSVEGTVTLPKASPPPKLSPRYATQAGALLPPEPPTAIVYLEGAPLPPGDAPPTNAVPVLQQGMQFMPGLLAVRKGTRVAFPNGDDFYHNVFSYSKAKRFDLGRFLKTETPPAVTFDQPGVVKLYCEIHEHMRGVLLVLETPHFTKTDTNGTFRLTGLPVGRFKLKAWADEKNAFDRDIEIKPGAPQRVNFPGP